MSALATAQCSDMTLPKNSFRGTAVPFDVRKASGLPASSILNFGLRPGFGAQPQIRCANRRKRGALPHIRRHSRIPAELFKQSFLPANSQTDY